MSDQPAQKKGMRTFASDFERVKGATSHTQVTSPQQPTVPTPEKTTKEIPAPPKTIAKTIQKPEASKKIPAFHEIEKNLGDIDLSGAKKGKGKNKAKGITPSRQVGGGAIITDTKTHSFSLFSETKKSIINWFKSRKKKATPKLAVSVADRRKGVIQQATTKSGTIFTADNETLKERIKARKLQEQNKPHEPETNWSPYTETGYSLLEAGQDEPQTTNVVVEFKKRSVPPPVAAAPEPIAEPVIEPEVVPEPAPAVVPKPITPVAHTVDAEPTPTPTETEPQPPEPEPAEVPTMAPEVNTTPAEEVAEPVLPEPETDSTTKHKLTTNQLTMYVSGGLALVLVTGFFGWIIMNSEPTTPTNTANNIESLVTGVDTQTMIVDQTFTIASLTNYSGSASYTEIVLINNDKELLPSALVFELVAPAIPTTIQRYATTVRFIQSGTTAPQILISIVDPTSVTGALLASETELIAALTPLYGKIDAGKFADTSIAGIDTRVLGLGSGQTITYGIINEETLVIAASPDAFAEISTLFAN